MIVGGIAAVVVLAVLFLLFGRDGGNPITNALGITSPAPPVPEFAFKTVTPKYEATQAHMKKTTLEKAAKQTAPAVQDVITKVLQAGYVDPDTWGDKGAIDDYFTQDAAGQIDSKINVLTLGTDVTFTTVTPSHNGKLKVTTLLDGNAQAIRAYGEFTFKAKAANEDGSSSKIQLSGTFFLVPDGGDWKIEAFHLSRQEKPHKAHTPSGSASDTGSPTATGSA
jgi:hypothetical protein